MHFLRTLRRYGVMIGQPAHHINSFNTFEMLCLPEEKALLHQRLYEEAVHIQSLLAQDKFGRRDQMIGANVSSSEPVF